MLRPSSALLALLTLAACTPLSQTEKQVTASSDGTLERTIMDQTSSELREIAAEDEIVEPSFKTVESQQLIPGSQREIESDPPEGAQSDGNRGPLGIGILLPPKPRFFTSRDLSKLAPVQNDQMRVPLVPPHNTSNDGRIGFNIEVGWSAEFTLNLPEKFSDRSILDAPNGASMQWNDGLPFGKSGYETCVLQGLTVRVIDGTPHGVPDNSTITVGWNHGCVSPQNIVRYPEGNPKTVYVSKKSMWPLPNNSNLSLWDQDEVDAGWGGAGHHGICDPGQNATTKNPSSCEFNGAPADCYTLDVIVPQFKRDFPSPYEHVPSKFRMKSIRFQIVVENPKTPQAAIVRVSKIEYPEGGPRRYTPIINHRSGPTPQGVGVKGLKEGIGSVFEPIFTADGRLFVTRFGNSPLKWRRNDGTGRVYNDNAPEDQRYLYDIVYASIPADKEACDIREFSREGKFYNPYKPLAYAPKDPNVNARYPFAFKPFRDAMGKFFADDTDTSVTYPWIDRQGRNIFFTTLVTPLHFENIDVQTGEHVSGSALFNTRCIGGVPLTDQGTLIGVHQERCKFIFTTDEMLKYTAPSSKLGIGLMGSWTNGKMILLDSLNPIDFGLRAEDAHQREVALYKDGSSDVWVRVGASVSAATRAPGGMHNINLIQSWENLFNYRLSARPKVPRDVVWTMFNGHGMEEVIFDEYVDPNVLIYSDMTPAFEMTPTNWMDRNHFKLHNGINWYGWYRNAKHDGVIKLQNSATGFGGKFPNPPAAGVVSGNSRVEPVALGGYRGRGFYLTGSNKINYSVSYQPRLASPQWSYMLFMDNRQSPTATGRLLTFPNGNFIEVYGNSAVRFKKSNGTLIKSISIPPQLQTSWTHFAFTSQLVIESAPIQLRDGGSLNLGPQVPTVKNDVVEVFWNGYPLSKFTVPENYGTNLFKISSGNFSVGNTSGGFKGWIDELKVMSRRLGAEEYCNHAFGTLVKVSSSAELWSRAIAYPDSSHQAVSSELSSKRAPASLLNQKYACFSNFSSSKQNHVEMVPENTVAIRNELLHPEGRIVWNRPRPNSVNNEFCLGCHRDGGSNGLAFGMAALAPSATPAHLDPRRQPLQPPSRVWGIIPEGFTGEGQASGAQGFLLDEFLYPLKKVLNEN